MMIQSTTGRVLVLLVISASPLAAAETFPTFTDPAKAGPDFRVQGEYVGRIGNKITITAQVIALGGGKFDGILYGGGLPGAGWDGQTKFFFRGETKGGATHITGIFGERLMFPNPNFQGTIKEGVFRGTDLSFRNVLDDVSFVMKKVHRKSSTLGANPPKGAIVLFDGRIADEWVNGRIVEGNLLDVGVDSKRKFKDHFFHLEFRCPFMPTARGMSRGNSGVYVKKVWEIQIVDSFGWNAENRKYERLSIFAKCGGLHELFKPRVNMSYPPLSWQTYDVDYRTARFDRNGKRISPAMMTVRHNGVLIHDKTVLPPAPPGGNSREGRPGPLFLQNHGNPVRFRNIWVVENL